MTPTAIAFVDNQGRPIRLDVTLQFLGTYRMSMVTQTIRHQQLRKLIKHPPKIPLRQANSLTMNQSYINLIKN